MFEVRPERTFLNAIYSEQSQRAIQYDAYAFRVEACQPPPDADDLSVIYGIFNGELSSLDYTLNLSL